MTFTTEQLMKARTFAAEISAIDPIYLPIFERRDADVSRSIAMDAADPVARARAMDHQRARQNDMA